MSKIRSLFVAFLLAMPSTALAGIITDSNSPLLSGAEIIDFETPPDAQYTGSLNPNIHVADFGDISFISYPRPSNFSYFYTEADPFGSSSTGLLMLTLSTSVTISFHGIGGAAAFGADFHFLDRTMAIRAFDEDNQLLGSKTLSGNPVYHPISGAFLYYDYQFLGFGGYDRPINSVALGSDFFGTDYNYIIDNVRYVRSVAGKVSEPSVLVLLGSGLIVFCLVRTRKSLGQRRKIIILPGVERQNSF